MSRQPLHMVNDGTDKLHEAQQLIDLIISAAQNDRENEPIAVGAVHAADLLREVHVHLGDAAKLLRGETA